MSKHTPGPWTSDSTVRVAGAYDFGMNLEVVRSWMPDEQQELWANARLISAAPDLLDALKQMVDYLAPAEPVRRAAFQIARAAIAKAEGAKNPIQSHEESSV